ncbi:MAG: IS982 family transposase [Candidatus Saccharimonadales bacterium]
MRLLRAHHITNLVEVVDSFLPRELPDRRGGRPIKLHQNEVIALLVFSSLAAPQRTLTGIHKYAQVHYYRKFNIPAYSTWMKKCNAALPAMLFILDKLLVKDAPLRFMDSTMLEVCKLVRADRHKVAKGIADFGMNWQGWHYGFKLHAAVNPKGQLCALHFTPANESDSQQIPKLVNDACMVAVGDGGYTASVMRRKMWREHKAFILSPPHPKQTKKVLAKWQHLLLRARPKVECTFDYLKEHLFLNTSFPRSVQGYFTHYVRVLLSYQLMWGF